MVEVSGARGQTLSYELLDLKGNVVNERQVDNVGSIDQQTLDFKGSQGTVFILRVRSSTNSQTVKVIRAE
ncbi:hypothetical protein GCM10027299_18290 [Larkinella ripae]